MFGKILLFVVLFSFGLSLFGFWGSLLAIFAPLGRFYLTVVRRRAEGALNLDAEEGEGVFIVLRWSLGIVWLLWAVLETAIWCLWMVFTRIPASVGGAIYRTAKTGWDAGKRNRAAAAARLADKKAASRSALPEDFYTVPEGSLDGVKVFPPPHTEGSSMVDIPLDDARTDPFTRAVDALEKGGTFRPRPGPPSPPSIKATEAGLFEAPFRGDGVGFAPAVSNRDSA